MYSLEEVKKVEVVKQEEKKVEKKPEVSVPANTETRENGKTTLNRPVQNPKEEARKPFENRRNEQNGQNGNRQW